MAELEINQTLVGQTVRNAARPEWGAGKVLRVQEVRQGDTCAHRVSVQFQTGHKTMLVPPARLTAPTPERQRSAGWIDQLAGTTTDDVLRKLPPSVTETLGGPRARIAALLPLYAYTPDPQGLVHWARRQTDIADPLSQWNRDELEAAFTAFAVERDAALRGYLAEIKQREGPAAVKEILAEVPAPIKPQVEQALRRPI
jgi:hypothetical protein